MSLKAMAAAKAAATQTKTQTEKGATVTLKAVREGDNLVVRIPLKYAASDCRMTSTDGKKKVVSKPFVALVVDLADSHGVTISDGNDSLEVFTRRNLNFNLFLAYSPVESHATESGDE